MKSFEYTIKDPMGLHARPAGVMVKMCSTLESDITLETNGKTANAKKIIAVMGLGAKQGAVVKVNISGNDEDSACEKLKEFFEANF